MFIASYLNNITSGLLAQTFKEKLVPSEYKTKHLQGLLKGMIEISLYVRVQQVSVSSICTCVKCSLAKLLLTCSLYCKKSEFEFFNNIEFTENLKLMHHIIYSTA